MSLILLISIIIRLVAMVSSVALLRRLKDWRMGFFTILLALMALRQIFTLIEETESWATVTLAQPEEIPGLLVSCLAFAAVFYLKRLLDEQAEKEKALLESQARYQDLYENAPDAFVSVEVKTGNILACNKALPAMIGSSKEHIIGKHVSSLYHQTDRPKILQALEQFRARGEVRNLELQLLNSDGGIKEVLVNASAVRNEEGHIVQTRSIVRDVTEQKKIERDLRNMNIALANAMPGISELNVEGKYVSVNQEYGEFLGYQPDELIGQSWKVSVHSEDHEIVSTAFKRMQNEGKGEFEARAARRDGSVFHKHVLLVAKRNETGDLAGWHCFMRDITERKKVEQEALRREQELAGILDIAEDAIITIDENQRILRFNQGAEKVFGFTSHEVLGNSMDVLLPQQVATLHGHHIQDFKQSSASARRMGERGEVFGMRKDESQFPAEASISKLLIEDKTIFTVILRDVTERKKAEDRLNTAFLQLRRLTQRLSMAEEEERKRIARDLHDEFGQNLAGLKFGLSQLDKQLLEELSAQSSVVYHNQLKSMVSTVETAIHTMRRIATELRPSLLDTLGLFPALESLVQNFQEQTSLSCTLTVSPELSTVVIDPERSVAIYRIIQELLTNALKHARASHVAVILSLEDGIIVLDFTDDGRGVTKQELEHTKSLGLLGIRERLSAFDGQFTIQGEPGKGTRVALRIPLSSVPTSMTEECL